MDLVQAQKTDKRQRILDGALQLFSQRGYDSTPVPEIAKTAGIAAGTIYRYFPGKEALVNELFRYWKTQFRDSLASGFPVDATVRQQFTFLWRAMQGFATTYPVAFSFLETHFHGAYLDEANLALEEEVLTFACTYIENGIKAGALKELPADLLVTLVFGAFVGVVKAVNDGHCELHPESFQLAESCCWDAIANKKDI